MTQKLLLIFILTAELLSAQQQYPLETVLQKGHSQYVECMAFSPDGKYLATGSYDNSIKLWDIASGKEIRSFTRHTGRIRSLQFSGDGRFLLSASSDNKACVFDIITGNVVHSYILAKERLMQACFSPHEKYVLLKDDRSGLFIWDRETENFVIGCKTPYSISVQPGVISDDETKILEYISYKGAQIVDIKTGDTLQYLEFDKPYSMSFSPDGKQVLIGSTKLFAEIFDAATGEKKHHLEYDTEISCDGCNTKVCYSNDGKRIVTLSKKTGIAVWNASSGKLLRTLMNDDDSFDHYAFSPDDKYFYAQRDDKSFVWNAESGQKIIECDNDGLDYIPAFSSKGDFAVADEYNTASIRSLVKGRKMKTLQGCMNKKRSDGLRLHQSNWTDVMILNYLNTKPAVDLHPDGIHIVKGKIDSVAEVINLQTGQVEFTLKGHGKQVIVCRYSPDGRMIATAGGDGDIRFWNAATGALIKIIEAHNEMIFDLAFSSDGAHIASASWSGDYRIFDVQTGDCLKRIDIEGGSPFRLRYTPFDLYILCSDVVGKCKLWEADTGEEFRSLVGHSDVVFDFAFSPDGKAFATASRDGKMKIWDLLTGMQICKSDEHGASVNAVAWSPKNTYIAAGGDDHKIHLIDPVTGKQKAVLEAMGAVAGLAFNADGSQLLSTSVDGSVQLWDIDSLKELYTYIQIDRNNWLAKVPGGRFDGSASALKNINYVSGLEVISIDALFERYYTPKLIQRVMDGEQFPNDGMGVLEHMKQAPEVHLVLQDKANHRGEIFGQNDTIEAYSATFLLETELTDRGGGIDELRVYNNGKLVLSRFPDIGRTRAGDVKKQQVELDLSPGINELSVVALNKNRIESAPEKLLVYFDGVEPDVDLYMLVVGIDKYENPAYHLSYATGDAKAYIKEIDKGAAPIFKTVTTKYIKDSDASKETIKQAFTDIAANAGAEDVFLFYYAGHGTMSIDEQSGDAVFFIVPYDVTKLYGDYALLQEKALSADELLEFSKSIKARKQMFVLDACQSGGALKAMAVRGAGREKAIAQLARSSGTYFLLASGAIQYASEAKDLGHGLFTYAILEALNGKADGGMSDKKITANELKAYVEERVPELTKQYHLTPQYPTGYSFGQDFPLVLTK